MTRQSTLQTACLCATIVIVATIITHAGSLNPPAGPVSDTTASLGYKTLAQLESRTPIGPTTTPGDALAMFRITQPGSYYLTGNINAEPGKSGIYIVANNVTLDLGGFVMDGAGSGASAVRASGSSVTVRGGRISGWTEIGVDLEGDGGQVENALVRNCVTGISAGHHSVVSHCSVSGCSEDGIECNNQCAIIDCYCFENGFAPPVGAGIHALGSGNRIDGNQVAENNVGIKIDSSRNIITRNIATGNAIAAYVQVAGNMTGEIVTLTSSDGSLTSANSGAWSNFQIGDTVPPVITSPSPIVTEATSAGGAIVTFIITANDTMDGPVPVTTSPTSGSQFPLGITTVSCTATDNDGNIASAGFTVTVSDTSPPILSLPASINVPATGPSGAVVTFAVSANDVVDGPIAVTAAPPSGSQFSIGTTLVECSAIDSHGNTGSASFFVTVTP